MHPVERRKFTIAELRRICAFPDDFVLVGSYAQQWARLGNAVPYDHDRFKAQHEESMAVLNAMIDDNDYGMRNGNRTYPKKTESQQLYLDFLDEPKDSPRRRQEGVYTSYLFGEPTRQIKIILLDLRYNSDEPGPESDLLGEAQWRWLADELKAGKDDVVLIGSSIQLLSSEHPYDHWGHYPKARKRICSFSRTRHPSSRSSSAEIAISERSRGQTIQACLFRSMTLPPAASPTMLTSCITCAASSRRKGIVTG